jgi:hypothetical protein
MNQNDMDTHGSVPEQHPSEERFLMTDGGEDIENDVEQYFEDDAWDEVGGLFEASKQNESNSRLATLAGIDEVQRQNRVKGDEAVREVNNLDSESYDFVPADDSWCLTNIRNNADRYKEAGVLGDEYVVTGKGIDLMRFVDEVQDWFQSSEYFEQEVAQAFSDDHEKIAESMGHEDEEASNQVASYLNDIVNVDPVEENPLGDRDYTGKIASKLRSLQGDRIKAYMALADNPELSHSDISAHLSVGSPTISDWKNNDYGWRATGLMEEESNQLTAMGEAFYEAAQNLYKERS